MKYIYIYIYTRGWKTRTYTEDPCIGGWWIFPFRGLTARGPMDYLSSLYQPRREKWRRSFVSGGRTSANRGNFVAATSTVTLPPRLEGSEVAYPRFAEDNSPFLYQLGRPTPSPFADFVATDTSNLQPSPLSFSPIVKIAEESREEWSPPFERGKDRGLSKDARR